MCVCSIPKSRHGEFENMTGWVSGMRVVLSLIPHALAVFWGHKPMSSPLMTPCSHRSAALLWRSIRWDSAHISAPIRSVKRSQIRLLLMWLLFLRGCNLCWSSQHYRAALLGSFWPVGCIIFKCSILVVTINSSR